MRLVLATITLAIALPPADAAARVVLADGHVDYAARVVGGKLQSRIKDSTSGRVIWRRPGGVVFHARPGTRTRLPDDGAMDFLGDPGDPVWVLPQTQESGILWAGWNTEQITKRRVRGAVRWTLRRVRGPGRVAVFQTGAFGDHDILFNSTDGLPDRRRVPLGTHAHGNWAFTAVGRYRLTFELRAAARSGRLLRSTATLAVAVGDVDPSR
jgi:putative ABC transporter-associated repeat protein